MGARESSALKARTMLRANKKPPNVKPIAEESAPQKKPYVFARAFARLLGVHEEQAVAGYLASTTPGEPHSTHKVTEIPNPPNMKLPPVGEIQARVTKSVAPPVESHRATSPSQAKAPSESSPRQPMTQTGGRNRKVTEIPNPPNMKLPPVGEIQARVTKSVPTQGEGNRATSLQHSKAPWESSLERPITQPGGESRKVTEIPKSPNMKLPRVGEIQARVTKSVPTQGEGNRATSLQHSKAPWESSLGRPITQPGGESRKVTEIPKSPNMKLPPVGEIQARVTKSVPPPVESHRATRLPQAKEPLESSLGRPTTQTGGENRKVTEIPNSPNMKFPPVGEIEAPLTKSIPAQGESNRATRLPQAKEPSESTSEQPTTQTGGENCKLMEIPNSPNTEFPPVGEIEALVTKSAPAQGDINPAKSLPQAKAPSESSPGWPITQNGAENREVTKIFNPSIMKLRPIEAIRAWVTKSASIRGKGDRPINLSWETFSILVLVVTLGFAGWGFYTRDTRAHAVPPDSNTSASISPPAVVASSKVTKGLPSFEVRIKAHKNVRVLIKADGRKVTEETLTGGAERSVRAANQVIVKSGNLGALDLEFNGRRLPSQGAYGEVKTLEFGPSGLEVIISHPPTRIKPGE